MRAVERLEELVDAAYVFDFEYWQTPGNNPLPVCVTLKNIFTGVITQHWLLGDKALTKLYFKKGKAKVEIAVAKGKKQYDKDIL